MTMSTFSAVFLITVVSASLAWLEKDNEKRREEFENFE